MKINALINELFFLSQMTKSLLSIKTPEEQIKLDILGGLHIDRNTTSQIEPSYLNDKSIVGAFLISNNIDLTFRLIPDAYHDKYDFSRSGNGISISKKIQKNEILKPWL